LKLHTDLIIVATGYVDAAGPPPALAKRYPTTWEWSAARAAIVVRELVEGYGVSPHRFTAAGRGDQDPVASNDTPEGRLQNRRIVFSIEPGPSSMAPSSSTSQGQP
jgi:chemotaxis protein MotB